MMHQPPAFPPSQPPQGHPPQDQSARAQSADDLREALNQVRGEVAKAVVGQDQAVTALLIGILCRGHVLLEGVPGVAKTLLVRSVAKSVQLDSHRVQFTPDLMPGDVTGSLVYDSKTGEFEFRKGPVFTHVLLADEINRTPPKTQAALLEAMAEYQVSTDGVTRRLPDPFMVAATQNPVEHEGTYPLPEAQLDRFLLKVVMDLPERDQEREILRRHAAGFSAADLDAVGIQPVAEETTLLKARASVQQVATGPEMLSYITDIVRATRQSPSFQLGASPRGGTALMHCAKAWAWLSGRNFVTPDDVQSLLLPTLRHRVLLRPEAELDGVDTDQVLTGLLSSVPVPR
ncbi:MoxR family ATPase [Auritidibacter ignavus]|nr:MULTISPECIES: MoxR family ATPase [Auritidibacter]NIH71618.1 MoxR-like ATPase [Auritidibacter ignavus]WGH81712.1 MoxR family ATPase [Auritidibacter ignavus]WGH86325.1 MoxR family ATPase [Auritidibacter ignavus]WGH88609.1 MoxR family ATPase [Auritidibacter ignavus]